MAIKPRHRQPPRRNDAAIDAQTITKLTQLIDTQTQHINQLKYDLALLQHRHVLLQAVITGLDEALAGLQSRTWWDEVDMTTGEVPKSQPHHRKNP
jgi:hypothetical protein